MATIPVENPATGETIRDVPVTPPGRGRRARGARPLSPAGLGGARLRGPRPDPQTRAEVADRARGRGRGHDRRPRRARRARTPCWSRSPTARTRLAFGRRRRPNGLRTRRSTPSTPSSSAAGWSSATAPLGVVGVIGPWNYPLVNSVGDAIPALAAGNAVIVKPSEVTPLTSLLFERGLHESWPS